MMIRILQPGAPPAEVAQRRRQQLAEEEFGMPKTSAQRRQEQAALEAAWAADQAERPNVPPAPIAEVERCPVRLGGRHDFTMRGTDGRYRCWFCVQVKPE